MAMKGIKLPFQRTTGSEGKWADDDPLRFAKDRMMDLHSSAQKDAKLSATVRRIVELLREQRRYFVVMADGQRPWALAPKELKHSVTAQQFKAAMLNEAESVIKEKQPALSEAVKAKLQTLIDDDVDGICDFARYFSDGGKSKRKRFIAILNEHTPMNKGNAMLCLQGNAGC